jgi:hypothetical protein
MPNYLKFDKNEPICEMNFVIEEILICFSLLKN